MVSAHTWGIIRARRIFFAHILQHRTKELFNCHQPSNIKADKTNKFLYQKIDAFSILIRQSSDRN